MTVFMTTTFLIPMVLAEVFVFTGSIDFLTLIFFTLGTFATSYVAYSWRVNEWSFPTGWPND